MVWAPLTIFGQLLIVWASGSPIRPSTGGLAFFALLLVGLVRRSVLAWNAMMLAVVAGAMFSGSPLTVALPIIFHAVSIAVLLTEPTRRHVGFGSRPTQPA